MAVCRSALAQQKRGNVSENINTNPTKNQILLQEAQARLAEGYAILPLTTDGKRPLPFALNKQGVGIFHNGVHSSYSASFGPRREYTNKKTGKKRWTTAALQAWWDGHDGGIAIALELSGLCVLDVDTGIDNEEELIAFLKDFGIPITRCIRSGRVSSFGCHLYFLGVMQSGSFEIQWRGKTVKGEVKSCAPRYVVSEGSIHKSGQRYTRIWNIPRESTPVTLFTEILAKYPPASAPVDHSDPDDHIFEGDSVTSEEFEAWAEKAKQSFTDPIFHQGKNAFMYLREGGCPWAHLHTGENHDGDFAVFIPLSGRMSATCMHQSCKSAWTESGCWKSFRAWVDKEAGWRIPLQASGVAYVG